MNKLTYEEVLECVNHFIEDIKETTKYFIQHVKTALEQAQKQEKLLKFYKELVKEIKDYILGNINDIDYSNTVLKVNNLDKQIKELENNEK